MLGMRIYNGWRQLLYYLPLIFFLPYLFSVLELHHSSSIDKPTNKPNKKFDHLVLGPAAGQGLPDRLQCEGIKALNETHFSSVSNTPSLREHTSIITVFTIYNTSVDTSSSVESMPQSNVIILTDPASEFSIHRDRVAMLPIPGEYARDKLMLQRIRSYIVFLEKKLEERSWRQDDVHNYIFTDSDMAVIDDLGQIFYQYSTFHIALTFRNNKDQPLNSGFIAVKGTREGILKAKFFLQEVLQLYISKYMKASKMLGDQLALAWFVKSCPSFDSRRFSRRQAFLDNIHGTSVLFLPCALYNWTPPEGAGQFHGMPLDVKVIHFKGSRKRLMLEAWNFYNSSASPGISDMLCLVLMSGRTKYDF
ncbi:hypothetical protein Sjap_008877 [Stephania japonica]|uniref:Uncharacterized protein n=1 Tax=Stephania japonica TaxID=461633 RepID=A0AAP0JQE8_9MAGN